MVHDQIVILFTYGVYWILSNKKYKKYKKLCKFGAHFLRRDLRELENLNIFMFDILNFKTDLFFYFIIPLPRQCALHSQNN